MKPNIAQPTQITTEQAELTRLRMLVDQLASSMRGVSTSHLAFGCPSKWQVALAAYDVYKADEAARTSKTYE